MPLCKFSRMMRELSGHTARKLLGTACATMQRYQPRIEHESCLGPASDTREGSIKSCAQFSSNLFWSKAFRPILFFVQFTFVHDLYSSNLFSSNFSPFPFFVQKIKIYYDKNKYNIMKHQNPPKKYLERFLF